MINPSPIQTQGDKMNNKTPKPKNPTKRNQKLVIFTAVTLTIVLLSSNLLLIGNREERTKETEFAPNRERQEKIKENFANMKGFFTKNQGQLENDEVYFTYTSQEKTFRFSESSCLIKLSKTENNITRTSNLKLTFENSNEVTPKGVEELDHKSNFFIGNDFSKWKSNLQNYKKIIYKNLYEGIDLVYYFNEKGLKYDWIVKPYANPNQIVERFEGADSIKIDSSGILIINTETGKLREEKPYSYQKICAEVIEVDVGFRLVGKSLIYEIGDYDFSRDLIIDPLIYSTFIGGEGEDNGCDIAFDSENNVYITGFTYSSDFPTTSGCYDDSHNGYEDVFVLKLNSDCSDLIYSTFVGGNRTDYGKSIALDSENNG